MSNKQFSPILDDDEFTKLFHHLVLSVEEFLQLIEDYKYLSSRLDSDNLTDGEIDWLCISESQIDRFSKFVLSQFFKLKGSDKFINLVESVQNDEIIKSIHDQIHDRKQLNIANDAVLERLYERDLLLEKYSCDSL